MKTAFSSHAEMHIDPCATDCDDPNIFPCCGHGRSVFFSGHAVFQADLPAFLPRKEEAKHISQSHPLPLDLPKHSNGLKISNFLRVFPVTLSELLDLPTISLPFYSGAPSSCQPAKTNLCSLCS